MSKWIKFVVSVIILSIIIFLIMNNSKKSTMVYNAENTAGNTPGNLLNGGLFCENGDSIFFSNPNDNGTLYTMDLNGENFKKLYDDKVYYLNVAGKYIYYSRRNNEKKDNDFIKFDSQRVGVYRLNLSGAKIKQL